MRRREFIGLFGSLATILPSVLARAQQASPVVGFLSNAASSTEFVSRVTAFEKGLSDEGFVPGKSVTIEYRWADGDNDRLPGLVNDLIGKGVAAIAATGGTAAVMAVHATGTQIPTVFAMGADPVKFGLVKSFNRPEGNITGVSFLANALLTKQISILHEVIEKQAAIGCIVNPNNPNVRVDAAHAKAASEALGHPLYFAEAGSASEVERAVEDILQKKVGALLVFPDALFSKQVSQLAALASRYKLPAIYNSKPFAVAGGLLAYGTNQDEAYHQVGIYMGRILKGAKAGDLPVVQSTHFEFVVNLKSAKTLGLSLPPTLLATADEVIE
jgi:putative ABC transport system substrate-binding protein